MSYEWKLLENVQTVAKFKMKPVYPCSLLTLFRNSSYDSNTDLLILRLL